MPNLYITLKNTLYLKNLSLPIKGVNVILKVKNFKVEDFAETFIEKEEKDDTLSIDEYQDYWEESELYGPMKYSVDRFRNKIFDELPEYKIQLDNTWVDKIKFK